MSEVFEKQGACLCGEVRFTIQLDNHCVSACHCKRCRRWSGGPLLVVESKTPIRFEREDQVRIFTSSDWAERGFCGNCGSHVFFRLKGGGMYAVPVGLLDDDEQWQFVEQVFIDERPPYYCFANTTAELTGEQFFARAQKA